MAKQKKEEQVLDLYNLVAKAHDRLKKVHAKHLGTEKLNYSTIWSFGCSYEKRFYSIEKNQ